MAALRETDVQDLAEASSFHPPAGHRRPKRSLVQGPEADQSGRNGSSNGHVNGQNGHEVHVEPNGQHDGTVAKTEPEPRHARWGKNQIIFGEDNPETRRRSAEESRALFGLPRKQQAPFDSETAKITRRIAARIIYLNQRNGSLSAEAKDLAVRQIVDLSNSLPDSVFPKDPHHSTPSAVKTERTYIPPRNPNL